MQAVILCAGKGTRLNPLTENVPKVMLPVGGEPLLGKHIKHLKKYNLQEIFINLHYIPEAITNYLGTGESFGVKIVYSKEEKLLGTGGALVPLKKNLKETFFLLYGDILTSIDIDKLYKYHKKKRAGVTAVVSETDHPADSDLVTFDKDNRVEKLYFKPHEKMPETSFGLSAVYMIEASVLDLLPEGVFEFEKVFLKKLVDSGKGVYVYPTDEVVKDIGTPERYARVNRGFKDSI